MDELKIEGNLVDIHAREIYPAEVTIKEGRITRITRKASAPARFIIPGFVDAHVHIESSMLTPCEFGRAAVVHGTVATVSDPHEIANVLGVKGVEFMLRDARSTPVKICFGASPCVPATVFETAGATLGPKEVESLLERSDIGYLSEVMNYPGVLAGDPDLMEKIAAAKRLGKPVDGHAPGVRGADAARYAAAGIETDHECFTLDEALDKIAAGMWIIIREGSAAANFAALEPLLRSHPSRCMFCTDDIHPDSLQAGHINRIVVRAVAGGADLFDVLRAASLYPVTHYHLGAGLLRKGDAADFVIVEDLTDFRVLETWIDGRCVASGGVSRLERSVPEVINQFNASPIEEAALVVPAPGQDVSIRVIVAEEGQLVTGEMEAKAAIRDGLIVGDPERDILKIVVLNRYENAPPAVAFINGFGIKSGAIASSVAHDSHNVIAVGADDSSICRAINAVVAHRGGLCFVSGDDCRTLALPIAGLISDQAADVVAREYAELDAMAKRLGSSLAAPFMTLSFMALLVIPDLKLSDKGLFSGRKFAFEPLVIQS